MRCRKLGLSVAPPQVAFGEFRFEPATPLLTRNSRSLEIAPKALKILAVLVRNAGQVVSKDDLLSIVWPNIVVEEGNLAVYISALRKALGENACTAAYIETIPKRGYRFAVPVYQPPQNAEADPANDAGRALKTLLDDYQRQLDDLLPLRQLVKGSVYDLQTRCGKPSYDCASDPAPPHTATELSWSDQGKTRLRTLPPIERAHFQWAQNYRRFRHARAALVKLHQRILAHIDRLQAVLQLPPPKPASHRRKR